MLDERETSGPLRSLPELIVLDDIHMGFHEPMHHLPPMANHRHFLPPDVPARYRRPDRRL